MMQCQASLRTITAKRLMVNKTSMAVMMRNGKKELKVNGI